MKSFLKFFDEEKLSNDLYEILNLLFNNDLFIFEI